MFEFIKEFKREVFIFIMAAKSTTMFFLLYSAYINTRAYIENVIEVVAVAGPNRQIEKIRAYLDSKAYIYSEITQEDIIELAKKLGYYGNLFFDYSTIPPVIKIKTHFLNVEAISNELKDSGLFSYIDYSRQKLLELKKINSIFSRINLYFRAAVFITFILSLISIIIKPYNIYNLLISWASGWAVPAVIGIIKLGVIFFIVSIPVTFSVSLFLWSLTFWEREYL